MSQIRTVAIVGGTHGNEVTGIYLLKKWQKDVSPVTRASFSTELVHGNPRAHKYNVRYCDQDLNRQFALKDLNNPHLAGNEQSRAKALNQQLGPKGANPRVDFIIDLHTTTSNMGTTLLIERQHPLYYQLAAYVKQRMPHCIIIRDEDDMAEEDNYLLCTLGRFGVIVEVGPTPQGVLKQQVFEESEQLTLVILDFIEHYNNGTLPALPATVEAYHYVGSLKLPTNDVGERTAMVHSHVDGKDFQPLNPGDPLFAGFDGSVIAYKGEQTVYPAFVNEAAYYDSNGALSLHEKVVLKVEPR